MAMPKAILTGTAPPTSCFLLLWLWSAAAFATP
jgi:hypothetical protein